MKILWPGRSAPHPEHAVLSRELEALATAAGAQAAEGQLATWTDQRPSVLGSEQRQALPEGRPEARPDLERCGPVGDRVHLTDMM